MLNVLIIYTILWTLLVVSNPVIVFIQCRMVSLCMLSLWSWFYVPWNYVPLAISSQVIKLNQRYTFSFLYVSICATCRLLSCDGIQSVQVFLIYMGTAPIPGIKMQWALHSHFYTIVWAVLAISNPVIEFNQWST